MLSLLWPRPARLIVGGQPASVVPLRLADLAGLEQWACGVLGTPAAMLYSVLSVPDAPARHDELRRLDEFHKRGGIWFGLSEVRELMATNEGHAEQLRLSCRVRDRRTGRVSRPPIGLCREMAREANDEERFAWGKAAWQAHPRDELARAIDAEIGAEWPAPHPNSDADPSETAGDSWAMAAWSVIEATGWTFAQLGRLTLAQWDIARLGDRCRKDCYLVPQTPPGVDPRAFDVQVMAKRAAFWDGWPPASEPTSA